MSGLKDGLRAESFEKTCEMFLRLLISRTALLATSISCASGLTSSFLSMKAESNAARAITVITIFVLIFYGIREQVSAGLMQI